jgi:S1-C subfamily serine protease
MPMLIRFSIYLFIFVLIGLVLGSMAQAATLKEVIGATYKLYQGDRPVCSGQFVKSDAKDDFFLTAAHCIDAGPEVTFSVRKQNLDEKFNPISEQIFYLKPVRVMKRKDVALLRAIDPSGVFDTVEVASVEEAAKLQIGSPVVVIGYPKVLDITYTAGEYTGKVRSPMEGEIDSPLYRTTAPLTGGSSGGGLYMKIGENQYKLFGTTTGTFRDVSFMNYFATVESVNDVIRTFVGQRATPTPAVYNPADQR